MRIQSSQSCLHQLCFLQDGLPIERAGWKYTATVATRCIPSLFPRNSANGSQKVARLPIQYASEHFSILNSTKSSYRAYLLSSSLRIHDCILCHRGSSATGISLETKLGAIEEYPNTFLDPYDPARKPAGPSSSSNGLSSSIDINDTFRRTRSPDGRITDAVRT